MTIHLTFRLALICA